MKPHKIVDQAYVTGWSKDHPDKNIFFLQGGRGSGKSYLQIENILDHWIFNPSCGGKEGIFVAKRQRQLNSQTRKYVKPYLRKLGFLGSAKLGKFEWELPNVSGDPVYITLFAFGEEGADSRAEDIRGQEFCGGFADEFDNCNPEIRAMVISCMRGMKDWLFVTATNPGGEEDDWQEYIQTDSDKRDYAVLPTSANPCDWIPDYIENTLKVEFPLDWQQTRYIDGLPSQRQDLYWPSYKNYFIDYEGPYDYYIVGFDFGSKRISHAILFGVKDGHFHAIDEWMWNGEIWGAKDAIEQVDECYEQFMITTDGIEPRLWAVDMTSGRILECLERKVKGSVYPSYMTRQKRLEFSGIILQRGDLTLSDDLPLLRREMSNYRYPEDILKKRPEKALPLKKDDHAIDAMCFAMEFHNLLMYEPQGLTVIGGENEY